MQARLRLHGDVIHVREYGGGVDGEGAGVEAVGAGDAAAARGGPEFEAIADEAEVAIVNGLHDIKLLLGEQGVDLALRRVHGEAGIEEGGFHFLVFAVQAVDRVRRLDIGLETEAVDGAAHLGAAEPGREVEHGHGAAAAPLEGIELGGLGRRDVRVVQQGLGDFSPLDDSAELYANLLAGHLDARRPIVMPEKERGLGVVLLCGRLRLGLRAEQAQYQHERQKYTLDPVGLDSHLQYSSDSAITRPAASYCLIAASRGAFPRARQRIYELFSRELWL